MSVRDGYPAGVPCWVETSQPDPESAVSFYAGLFGWQVEDVATANAPGPYLMGRLRNKDVAADSRSAGFALHGDVELIRLGR
jgi:predicted enzyme related to lactoylglutathione lyase